MRARSILVMLLILAIVPAPSSAEQGPTDLLQDGTDDVQLQDPQGGLTPVPGATRPSIDLVRLHGEETPEAVRLTLHVVSLVGAADDRQRSDQYTIAFAHEETLFQVRIRAPISTDPVYLAALFRFEEASGAYEHLHNIEVAGDITAATLTATVPRDLLRDSNGAPPHPGRALGPFSAIATSAQIIPAQDLEGQTVGAPFFIDHASEGSALLPMTYGVVQTGHIELRSMEPFRYSNGAASTFVFRLTAINHGDAPDDITLSFQDVPPSWDVGAPATILRVPAANAEEPLEIPIVVRTVFSHTHGQTDTLVVEAASKSDPEAVGRIQIGIHYPEVPQPTGHHDTLWLHSRISASDPVGAALRDAFGTALGRGSGTEAYLSAHPDDEGEWGDEELPVPGTRCGGEPLTIQHCWDIPLRPSLKMGLDFDLDREGTIEVPITSTLPISGAVLHGGVWLQEAVKWEPVGGVGPGARAEERGETLLAAFEAAPVDLSPMQPRTLQATIKPAPEADYIQYESGIGLVLRLTLTGERPQLPVGPDARPELLPGGVATLPLAEYEDPVDEVFTQTGALRLQVPQQERLVNPGKTLLYQATLQNDGPEDALRIDISGTNVAWARLLTPVSVTVAQGQSTEIRFAVTAPAGSEDGDRADLVLEAHSATDPATRALVRLVTTVDTDADHPDEAALAGLGAEEKDASAAALALLVAALAALAMAWRRRT